MKNSTKLLQVNNCKLDICLYAYCFKKKHIIKYPDLPNYSSIIIQKKNLKLYPISNHHSKKQVLTNRRQTILNKIYF